MKDAIFVLTMTRNGIKRKKCKCSETCNKYPTISYQGYYALHAPQEVKDKVGNRASAIKKAKNARNKTSSLLRQDSAADRGKLLAMADKLFGDYIKMRDGDEQGIIICVCCGLPFHLKDKSSDGDALVNVLHYVVRSVYSLRFSELNAACGCAMCNLQMHLFPDGEAAINYRNRLINTIGEMKVIQMEEQRRNINKLDVQHIKDVIEKYTPKTKQQ